MVKPLVPPQKNSEVRALILLLMLELAESAFLLFEKSVYDNFTKDGISNEGWREEPDRKYIIESLREGLSFDEETPLFNIGDGMFATLKHLIRENDLNWMIMGSVRRAHNALQVFGDPTTLLTIYEALTGQGYKSIYKCPLKDRPQKLINLLGVLNSRLDQLDETYIWANAVINNFQYSIKNSTWLAKE